MADNTIDTLDIQISSSTQKAVRALENLSQKLSSVNTALGSLNTRGLRSYSKEIGRVTSAFNSLGNIRTSGLDTVISKLDVLSKINLNNLKDQKISIDLDIKGGDQTQKLQYAIDKTVRDIKIDTSSISKQIIDAFNLKGGAAVKIRSQMNELAEEMAKSFDGKDISANVGSTVEEIGNTILKSGSVVKSSLGQYLGGAEQEWVDFYDYFKSKKIYVSDMLKADIGKSEFSELLKSNLNSIVTDATKGITLNKSWDELSDRFPTLVPKDTINAAEQLITVLDNLKKVREEINPVSIESLFGEDSIKASDEVWKTAVDSAKQLSEKVKSRIENTFKNTNGELPIDVKINTDKITLDIQKAINKVAELKYNTVKVTLDVDTSKVKDAVSGKLKEIDAGQMTNIASGMERFSNSLKAMGGVNYKGSGLNAVINSINRLSQVDVSGFDSGKLGEIIHQLSGLADIPDVSYGVNRFVSSIAKLAGAGQNIANVSAELPGLGSSLKLIADNFASVGEISDPVNRFVQSIAQLSSAGSKIGQTTSQLGTLSREVLSFFDAMKSAPQISENTVRMTQSLAQLANASGKVNTATNSITNSFSRLSSATNALGNVGNKLASMMRSASSALSNFGNTASQTSKKTGTLTSQLASLYAKFFTVTRGIKALWNSVESASDYVETLNYFNSAFEQVTDGLDISKWQDAGVKSAEEYVGSFEKRAKELTKKMTGFEVSDSGDLTRTKSASLGLDPNQTMNYQATYAQMASSMGATADTATKLSQALTEIGADLASVKNLDFEDVWKDMASGMTGMSRALDKYGINIRVANLQQELYNLGIDTTVSKLSQTDKAILRTITVLNSTKYAWGDLAETINQPANQLRLLQSNFAALSRTIGSLFIPIISKVLPYLNALVIAVQRAFSWIGKLFGIKLSDYTASTGSAAIDMGDIADSTEDAASGLDSANKNAKKLKKTLSVLSFDELNQLNDQKSSSSSGSTGSSGGGSTHLPELDAALDDALSEYQKAWDEAFKNMNDKANGIVDKIVSAFKKIQREAKPTTDAIKKLYKEGLSRLGNFSVKALKNLWKNYLKPMGKWSLSNNSGLPRFFNITNDLLTKINWLKLQVNLEKFFTMLQKPTKFVWTGLMDFYEHFLVPVGSWTMNNAVPELIDALTKLGNNIHWSEINSALKTLWNALAPFAQNVGQGIVDFYKDLMGVGGDFINSVVPGGLNSIADAIKNISPETAQAIGKGLGQISAAILGYKGLTFIGGIIGKDSPLGKGLTVLAKHPYATMALGLAGIVTALDNFGIIDVDWDWIWSSIDRVKSALQSFIDKVDWNLIGDALGKLWDAFQPFAEGFADALITGLEGLVDIGAGLLNGISWAIDTLATVLSGIDPELIKQVGEAFGILFTIKIAKDFATKLLNVAGAITTFGTALDGGTVAASTSGFAKSLLGLSAALGGLYIGMKATENEIGESKDVTGYGTDMAKGFDYLSTAVEGLGDKAGISAEKQKELNTELENMKDQGLIYDPTPIQNFADKLYAAGIKADDLKNSAYNTSEVVEQLRVSLEDAAKAAEFQGVTGIDKLSGALDNMYNAGKIGYDQYKELNEYLSTQKGATDAMEQYHVLTEKMETMRIKSEELSKYIPQNIGNATSGAQTYLDAFNVSPLVEKLKTLTTESDKVSFAHMITETSNTIDSMGGIWENGKQILGEKALAIHDEIQKGLKPDEDGYYKLANGQMVQYGNAIKDNEQPIQNTLGNVLKKALSQEGVLPEGYKLMWDAAGYSISGYTQSLEDGNTTQRIQKAYEEALSIGTSLNNSMKESGGSLAKLVTAGYETYMKGTGKDNTSSTMKDWSKQGVTDPVETSLEIHSPSKVFARFAEYSELGFSQKIAALSSSTAITMKTWAEEGIILPLETIRDKFSSIGAGYISNLESGIQSEKQSIRSVVSSLADYIDDAFSGINLHDSGARITQSLVDGMKSVNLPNLMYRISSWTPHTVGGKTTSTPVYSPRWFAKGGLFNGAQVIGVGEAGQEAVLPLENPRTMKKIADSIVSSSDGTMGLSKTELTQAVAQGVAMAMSMNNGNNNPQYIMNSIMLDGSEIAKVVTKAQNDANSRYNPSPAY